MIADAGRAATAQAVNRFVAILNRSATAIWRDVKKVGAVYLRDRVCALPAAV